MKYLRLYKILRAYCLSIIFLLGMATIQSCDNDGDLPAEDEQADMQDTENTDPPEEEANDQNPSDFEDPAAEQGDITLYTVISGGDEIVKKMDFEVSGKGMFIIPKMICLNGKWALRLILPLLEKLLMPKVNCRIS